MFNFSNSKLQLVIFLIIYMASLICEKVCNKPNIFEVTSYLLTFPLEFVGSLLIIRKNVNLSLKGDSG